MGAVTFSIDPMLVEVLKSVLPLDIFIETGTFQGDTIEKVLPYFEKIYSIELSPDYYEQAVTRFRDNRAVSIIRGESGIVLRDLIKEVGEQSVLYWLDAHWCAFENTAGDASACPLLAELRSIGQLNNGSVILIDDARFFLSPPLPPHEISSWPRMHEILKVLQELNPSHLLMVVNDCILFFPGKAEQPLVEYARNHGVDWLTALDKSRAYDQALKGWQETSRAYDQALKGWQDKSRAYDQALKGWQDKSRAYEQALKELQDKNRGVLWYSKTQLQKLISPRIGNLRHHDPKPLAIPKRYTRRRKLMSYPAISIVTPAFNQGTFIERTIKSVIEQHYPELEYIVRDGASSDGTVEILKSYESYLKKWESTRDKGQANAINLGFKDSSGEIMAYLNSDDLLLPGSLHYVADFFTRHPDVDVIYGHRVLIDSCDQEIGRWVLPPHEDEILSWADYVPQETLFWRRRIWDKGGGYIDESFQFAMDWNLILRFRDAGAKFARLPRFLGAFRVHERQKTSASMSEIGKQEMARLRQRCHGRVVSDEEVGKNIRRYSVRHLLYNLLYKLKLLTY